MSRLIFKLKVKLLLTFNKVLSPCRMYREKPVNVEDLCYLCAYRGGWLRCKRSRKLKGME